MKTFENPMRGSPDGRDRAHAETRRETERPRGPHAEHFRRPTAGRRRRSPPPRRRTIEHRHHERGGRPVVSHHLPRRRAPPYLKRQNPAQTPRRRAPLGWVVARTLARASPPFQKPTCLVVSRAALSCRRGPSVGPNTAWRRAPTHRRPRRPGPRRRVPMLAPHSALASAGEHSRSRKKPST